jgi:hypothetical protein
MSAFRGKADIPSCAADVCFSNRPFGVKRFQTFHRYGFDVTHGLVLLFGIGTRGPSIMGFENEAERSFGRPCHQSDGRSKQTCDLTSFVVPQGTSCHRAVELAFSPIVFDLALSCCCNLLPSPAELSAVNEMVLAQGLGDADRQAPRREKDDRSVGAAFGRHHASYLGYVARISRIWAAS